MISCYLFVLFVPFVATLIHAEYDTALRYVRLQQIIAERIGDPVGIAAAWLNTAIVRNSQDELEEALEAANKKRATVITLNNISAVYLLRPNSLDQRRLTHYDRQR